MAQYTIIQSGSPLAITDGVSSFRYFVNGDMYLQQFVSGSWEDLEQYVNSGGGTWRVGARSLNWVMDCTITPIGFSGSENIDWENYEQHKLP